MSLKADYILYSDAIFDSVKSEPFAGAVAIAGDKIVYAGEEAGAAEFIGPDTKIKDFHGKMIMPGFIDAHGHYQTAAIREFGDCISHLEDCRSEEEAVQGVVEYLKKHPDCKRVHGRCFFLTSFGPGAALPTKHSLDAAVPDIPVYLISSSGHCSWYNSAAMKEADLEGLLAAHPEWPEEYAVRDEKGELTGFVSENPSFDIRWRVESYGHEDIAVWDEEYMNYLNSLGVTGFTECNCIAPRVQIDNIEPMKRLENAGKLTIRYHQWAGINLIGDDPTEALKGLEDLKYLQTYFQTDKLRVVGEKLMLDGCPDSFTGAMLQPYAGDPTTSGPLLSDPEAFKQVVAKANEMGFPVKVHCLGDLSTRTAIDAYEYSRKVNGNHGLRNAVEHMNIISDEDIPRMHDLDIIASVQPAHMCDWFNGCGEEIYGPELVKKDSRYRTLINAGVKIAVGTDSPVVDSNPIRTVYEAVTRRSWVDGELKCVNPEEAMTVEEVLKGYTVGAAYANDFEDKVGTLEAGKYADICVIDKNLFAIDPEEIKEAKNICTIFDGKIVYEA